MKTFIAVTTKDREEITKECIRNLRKAFPSDFIKIYDDCTSEYDINDLKPYCDALHINQKPQNIHLNRYEQLKDYHDNYMPSTKYDKFYFTDNDAYHDLDTQLLAGDLPHSYYNTKAHESNHIKIAESLIYSKHLPGISILINNEQVKKLIEASSTPWPINNTSWDYFLSDILGNKNTIEFNSEVEHYGAFGIHNQDFYRDVAQNPTPFLKHSRLPLLSYFETGLPIFSIVHATARPLKGIETKKKWLDLAEFPETVQYIFSAEEEIEDHYSVVCKEEGCAPAWNYGAKYAIGHYIICPPDDVAPIKYWDSIIRARMPDWNKPTILATSDGIRKDRLLTLPILTRAYLDQEGLFHEGFKSVFCDNYFTEKAYHKNKVIEARDLFFQHEHYSIGACAEDAVYKKGNSAQRYTEGKALYELLMEQLKSDKFLGDKEIDHCGYQRKTKENIKL